MQNIIHPIPLSLYIHIPWCVKKCPYCDFNSHNLKTAIPETDYINALITDLQQDLQQLPIMGREIHSVFIGGGTPSLLSPDSVAKLLEEIQKHLRFTKEIEITLEANPGTVEQLKFQGFREAGINRLSIGIQSFNSDKLKALGRIHDGQEAIKAVEAAQWAGFTNFNLDLMYGLPQQNVAETIYDLETALTLNPTHLSWYQLTLEANTAFYHHPPPLPTDDVLWEMQLAGQAFLASRGFHPYEISAYSHDLPSQHNLNYWHFGDYLGIGAGAHGKITDLSNHTITRTWKTKHPKAYLDAATPFITGQKNLSREEIPLEFMLNALRLYQPIALDLFTQRSGLQIDAVLTQLKTARARGLLDFDDSMMVTTDLGKRYLNDLLQIFL
ncbi:MAG TPA: radical SAM family heme chaperone HemW [Gammaproteobacteria bacterium]|nr:radical SAM family heme chaperone HemW [Gammaproteobacteria bacterium]